MGNSTGEGVPTPVEDVTTRFTYNDWSTDSWIPVQDEDRDEELCTEDENPF